MQLGGDTEHREKSPLRLGSFFAGWGSLHMKYARFAGGDVRSGVGSPVFAVGDKARNG